MTRSGFGIVLAAQALYGVVQFVVDNGAAFHGARRAAAAAMGALERASLVRLRLQLAAIGVAVTLTVGVSGGQRTLTANLPYAASLVIWALFNYWEPYGRGDARPWSAYIAARSIGPPAVTIPFLFAASHSPLYLPGLAECTSLLAVCALFDLRPFASARASLRAPRGPWRKVVTVGVPGVAWQLGLAAGTVILAVGRAASAAAVLGVGVRLLTGVNQLGAVVVTALFPGIARAAAGAPDAELDASMRRIEIAVSAVVVLAASALCVFLVSPGSFVELLLHRGGERAESTATLTLSLGGVSGISLLAAFVLVAWHREASSAVAFSAGTAVTVASALALAASGVTDPLAMAAALAAGQVVALVFITRSTIGILPPLRRPLQAGGAAGLLLLGAACAVVAWPDLRAAAAVIAGVVAVVALSLALRTGNEMQNQLNIAG